MLTHLSISFCHMTSETYFQFENGNKHIQTILLKPTYRLLFSHSFSSLLSLLRWEHQANVIKIIAPKYLNLDHSSIIHLDDVSNN